MAVNTSLVFTCKDDLGLSVGNLIDIRQTSAKLELRRTGVTDDMMGLNHFETQRRRREILERVHFAAKGPILCAGNSRRGHSSGSLSFKRSSPGVQFRFADALTVLCLSWTWCALRLFQLDIFLNVPIARYC